MTRDQWLRRCAQRLIEKAGMEPGEAAAMANHCAREQYGLAPARWDKPEDAADEEMSYWTDDEGATDEA